MVIAIAMAMVIGSGSDDGGGGNDGDGGGGGGDGGDSGDRVVVVLHSGERENAWSNGLFSSPLASGIFDTADVRSTCICLGAFYRSSSAANARKIGASEDAPRASSYLIDQF